MQLVLYGQVDIWSLRKLAEHLRDLLISDPAITQVELGRVPDYVTHVEIPQNRLREYGLTLGQVAARIRQRILSFELASDGLFTPAVPIGTGGCKKLEQQPYTSRTKQQVLPDLPPKNEQTIYCDLSNEERAKYDELAKRVQKMLNKPAIGLKEIEPKPETE